MDMFASPSTLGRRNIFFAVFVRIRDDRWQAFCRAFDFVLRQELMEPLFRAPEDYRFFCGAAKSPKLILTS
jgi:hypothetical protein